MKNSKWKSAALSGLRELAEYSYDKLLLIHSPPHRSISYGGAGIAYAFWKAACVLDSPEWLNQARFLIDHVAAAPEDGRLAKLPLHEAGEFDVQVEDSLFYGNRGLQFAQILIGHAEDNPNLYEKALKLFISPESKRMKQQELLQGIAGRLIGCALLYRQTALTDLKSYGDALAADLMETANISDHNIPWADNHRLGMAHGRAGNYYALLRWSAESGYKLPEWVYNGLHDYAVSAIPQKHGISWPIDEREESRYMNSWCNGAPGLILLWELAYRTSNNDPLFLDTALAAGEYCVHLGAYSYGHLCCGAAGVSYAMLCLNRINPEGPWLEHAYRFAEQARQGLMIKHWRMSLYHGLAGVICLMLDLDNVQEAQQPIMEG